ncbi:MULTISPECIES: protein kinase [unclassified Clostridium]|uniref:protein kinase n=1 Tax=unclassified Clostridium TaxID=2614128 RepID=UPI0025ED7687|nr:protein kinase [Clostridium sp.]MDY2629916.1 protein kinase [Clostridium sp.]MDY4253275.1 protein kinase [Clostridium sp.]MDY6228232.1 protein kinase [Clostridium sp.]
MTRTYSYSADFDTETEKLFKEAIFLGEGHNGIVYELPNNKAIKIFQEAKCCKEEGEILKKVSKSKYFPKIYNMGKFYIVRDKIQGYRLDSYIKKKGFSYEISEGLYSLISEFKNLKFTKIDARCRDIYITNDNKIMVIDPKQCYSKKVNYPRHLMKGLEKIGVLESFLEDMRVINKKSAMEWEKRYNQYLQNRDVE